MRNKTRLGRGLALGVVLTGLLASSVSAATTNVQATDLRTFSPKTITKPVGDTVRWLGTPNDEHTVTQDTGLFDTGAARASLNFSRKFSAGTYPYHCEEHGTAGGGGMAGTVRVPPQVLAGPRGLPFTVKWAVAGTNTGTRFDVQYKVGGGAFKTWLNNSTARSAVFGARNRPVRLVAGKTYTFRVRSGTATLNSGYSPLKSFRAR